jgi:hypothetical protein
MRSTNIGDGLLYRGRLPTAAKTRLLICDHVTFELAAISAFGHAPPYWSTVFAGSGKRSDLLGTRHSSTSCLFRFPDILLVSSRHHGFIGRDRTGASPLNLLLFCSRVMLQWERSLSLTVGSPGSTVTRKILHQKSTAELCAPTSRSSADHNFGGGLDKRLNSHGIGPTIRIARASRSAPTATARLSLAEINHSLRPTSEYHADQSTEILT